MEPNFKIYVCSSSNHFCTLTLVFPISSFSWINFSNVFTGINSSTPQVYQKENMFFLFPYASKHYNDANLDDKNSRDA